MDRLLALKITKKTSSDLIGLGEKTEIDYGQLAIDLLAKFIDVLEGVVVIVAGIIAVKFIKMYFSRIETQHERQKTAINLLEKITSGFVIVVAITLGLKIMGLDLTLIVSVLTLGLSFGMRDVTKNYVAGLLILFKSPFEIGDTVKIRAFTGLVERIEFQSVTIRTFDRKEVTIHNSDLLTQPITNFSKTELRRVEIGLRLGYGSDLKRAQEIFQQVLANNAAVLPQPKFSVIFKNFSDTGVLADIRFWVKRPCNILRVRSDLMCKIQEAFDEERLLAPYNREAGLEGSFGMNEARRERLKMFYGQPMLASLAAQTAAAVAVTANGNGAGSVDATTQNTAEDYADAEEPE